MLRFKTFILEAVLGASTKKPEEHVVKYIDPFVGSEKPTHTMDKPHENFSAGQRVFVHGHHVDEHGKYYAKVSAAGNESETVNVPFRKIQKPKTSYNEEHAIANMWNHSVPHGLHNSVERMHAEIEKAKKDPNHPLSFEKAGREGFLGKDKNAHGAKEAYFSQQKTAAHTVHALGKDKDISNKIKSGNHKMSVLGDQLGNLSSTYTGYGVKQGSKSATSKSDVKIGSGKGAIGASIKKSGGGQLASSGSSEFRGLVHAAANKMLEHGHITHEQHGQMLAHAAKIAEVQAHGKTAHSEEHDENVKQGQQHLNNLLAVHPKVNEYLRREATTGEGKFDTDQQEPVRPTHLIMHGENASVSNISNSKHDFISKKQPRFAKGKGGTTGKREYTVRIDS
jgi:hypothetical protein